MKVIHATILIALMAATSGCLVERDNRGDGSTSSPQTAVFTETWKDAGGEPAESEDAFEVESRIGPDHCGWESVVFLTIGWPLGTELQRVGGGETESRTYVRDRQGVIGQGFARELRTDVELPDQATFTGYATDDLELWLGPDEGDEGVYVVGEEISEWWPKGFPGCD